MVYDIISLKSKNAVSSTLTSWLPLSFSLFVCTGSSCSGGQRIFSETRLAKLLQGWWIQMDCLCWDCGKREAPEGSPQTHRRIIKCTNTDLRQWSPGAWALCCHCEDGGDAQCHSGWGGIHVDPEGDPGQNDNEQGRDVHLDQVVAHLTLQVEPHLNTSKFTCNKQRRANNIHLGS